MKSMFTADSRFNPQGATPVALAQPSPQAAQLAGAPAPQLAGPAQGWNAPPAMQQGGMPTMQQGAIPTQGPGAIPQQGGGGMQVPHGAQAVSLAGSVDPTAQRQPTLPQMAGQPQAQAQQPFFNRQPAPQAPQQQPQMGAPGEQVHVITVTAQGPDGRQWMGEYEMGFPRGSKILGVSEQVV